MTSKLVILASWETHFMTSILATNSQCVKLYEYSQNDDHTLIVTLKSNMTRKADFSITKTKERLAKSLLRLN